MMPPPARRAVRGRELLAWFLRCARAFGLHFGYLGFAGTQGVPLPLSPMHSKPTIAEARGGTEQPAEKARVDRWLWAARFFKTRSLAKAAVEGGRAHVNGARVKAARSIGAGDTLTISRGHEEREVIVIAVSTRRGSATEAAKLYRETEESVQRRAENDARRRMERAGLKVPRTRPTTRQRRQLAELKKT